MEASPPPLAIRLPSAGTARTATLLALWLIAAASGCTTIMPAVEVGIDYGIVPTDEASSYSVGVHLNGAYPQLDGYLLLRSKESSALGVGVRLGVPLSTWTEHAVYGRYDRVLGPRTRLLYNPGLGLHAGNSPNGQNPGHMVTLAQGLGLALEGDHLTFVPSLTLVLATGRRTSYGDPHSFRTVFGTLAASVTFHRKRTP